MINVGNWGGAGTYRWTLVRVGHHLGYIDGVRSIGWLADNVLLDGLVREANDVVWVVAQHLEHVQDVLSVLSRQLGTEIDDQDLHVVVCREEERDDARQRKALATAPRKANVDVVVKVLQVVASLVLGLRLGELLARQEVLDARRQQATNDQVLFRVVAAAQRRIHVVELAQTLIGAKHAFNDTMRFRVRVDHILHQLGWMRLWRAARLAHRCHTNQVVGRAGDALA